MRLLVSVTVLYLATSSVYSLRKTQHPIRKFPQYPEALCPCQPSGCIKEFCPRPGFCKGGTHKDCRDCCDVCAKVEGEKCDECDMMCDRGLKCKKNPLNPRAYYGICRPENTKLQGERCEKTAECAQGLVCEYTSFHRFGNCVTQRKLQGEKCEETAECAQGLVCKSEWNQWWSESVRICSTESPSSCSFFGKVLKDGESHTAKSIDHGMKPGCIKCTCRDGTCEYDSYSPAECHGQKKKKNYKNCYHNGKEIQDGQFFKWKCNKCLCVNGVGQCTMVGC